MVALKRAVWIGNAFWRLVLLLLAGFLWQENSLNVWQHATLGNCDSLKKFVQLFIVANSQL